MLTSKRQRPISSAFLTQDDTVAKVPKTDSLSDDGNEEDNSDYGRSSEGGDYVEGNTIDMTGRFANPERAASNDVERPSLTSQGSRSVVRKQPVQKILQDLYRNYSYQRYREQAIVPPTLDRLDTSVIRSSETLEAFCEKTSEVLLDIACSGVSRSYRRQCDNSAAPNGDDDDQSYSELLFVLTDLSPKRPLTISKRDIREAWTHIWNDDD